jgi:hypothetical protein
VKFTGVQDDDDRLGVDVHSFQSSDDDCPDAALLLQLVHPLNVDLPHGSLAILVHLLLSLVPQFDHGLFSGSSSQVVMVVDLLLSLVTVDGRPSTRRVLPGKTEF